MSILDQWAIDHGIPAVVLADLVDRLTSVTDLPDAAGTDMTESFTQSKVRLAAPMTGYTLWRKNVGALPYKNGRIVRYGLANDSAALNKVLKSSDLIGWRSVIVTPDMIGQKVAIFVARECKRPGWTFSASDERAAAQLRFIEMVVAAGGDAKFTTGEL